MRTKDKFLAMHPSTAGLPEEWDDVADTIAYDSMTSPPPVILVCGPPNTGKSTFSRHLLNALIYRYKRVGYMDTDVGQPEFTPPGCLSITVIDKLIPDLALPCVTTPERCYYYGDITPRTDSKIYLKYIHALYEYYHEKYQQHQTVVKVGVPLVVNTPGWVEGTGFTLLVEMLKHIGPTHVVKICVAAESKNLPPGAFWLDEEPAHQKTTIFEISSICETPLRKTVQAKNDARLLRDLRLLAYFRKCFPDKMSLATMEQLDYALATHPPHEIQMSAAITVKQLHPEIPRTETIYTTNSIIVGLAVSSLSSEDLPCCVGLGIAKRVDTEREILYLITPVPESMLKHVDLLLQGLIKIPDCLRQVQGDIALDTLRITD